MSQWLFGIVCGLTIAVIISDFHSVPSSVIWALVIAEGLALALQLIATLFEVRR